MNMRFVYSLILLIIFLGRSQTAISKHPQHFLLGAVTSNSNSEPVESISAENRNHEVVSVHSALMPPPPSWDPLIGKFFRFFYAKKLENVALSTRLTDLPDDVCWTIMSLLNSNREISCMQLVNRHFRDFESLQLMQAAVDSIRQHCSISGSLVFPSIELMKVPSKECTQSIIQSKNLFSIQTIRFFRVHIDESSARAIAAILSDLPLRHLHLYHCFIDDSTAIIIADALRNSSILELNMGSNKMTAPGITAVSNALINTPRLTTLHLPFSRIDLESAIMIGKVVSHSLHLTTLDLSNNRMTDESVAVIADALVHSKVHTLYLNDNLFGSLGCMAIARALVRSHVRILDLSNNHIGDECANALSSMLPLATSCTLILRSCRIGHQARMLLINVALRTGTYLEVWG